MKIAGLPLLFLLAACASSTGPVAVAGPVTLIRPVPRILPDTFPSPESTTATLGLVSAPTASKNCPGGAPKPITDLGPTILIARNGYALLHSSKDKIAYWVCERLTRTQVTGTLTRPKNEPFKADPDLPPGQRAELRDYKGSGYDRGHQAPSADQTRSQLLMDETYYLSNMTPQTPRLNQQLWRALEDTIRTWTQSNNDLYVISGPMFWDPREDSAATADGVINYLVIGPDSVAVPTHYYKIIARKETNGDWQSLAIVLENKAYPSGFDLNQALVSVEFIEKRTGLNFFPNLSKTTQAQLEGRAAAAMWN